MNAIADNGYTEAWRRLGEEMPRPKAILSISAHWFVPGTAVTIATAPRTIHDFGGFPEELYRVRYTAPGDPALASRIQQLLSPLDVTADNSWGLDHGTWSVLRHVYPAADIPVVQLSMDETRYPLNVNDEAASHRIAEAFRAHFSPARVQHTGPAPASEDFGCFGTAWHVPSVFCFVGGTDPDTYARAKAAGTLNELPVNHSPRFAPVIHPTLETGVETLVVATCAWLAA